MRKILALTVAGLLAGPAMAQTWAEVGDAGDLLNTGAQDAVGVGMLTNITGNLNYGNGNDDHVDAYNIKVTDAAAFFASTDSLDGGSFTTAFGNGDSRLYLFDSNGDLVMGNEDRAPEGNEPFSSYLSDPSTFPGDLWNNPGSVVAGETYTLVVTYFSNEIFDVNDEPLVDFIDDNFNFRVLAGQNPAYAGGPGTWENADFATGDIEYNVALGGAMFIPEPGSIALLALGGLLALRRR